MRPRHTQVVVRLKGPLAHLLRVRASAAHSVICRQAQLLLNHGSVVMVLLATGRHSFVLLMHGLHMLVLFVLLLRRQHDFV